MFGGWSSSARAVWLLIGGTGIGVGLGLEVAPLTVMLLLATAFAPWAAAWRDAEGTALRGALVWGAIVLGLGIAAQVVALTESPASGRPMSGRITYVMTTAVLAGLTSVLNARRPGDRVWALLMALLLVVFLIPWLEGSGRMRKADGLAVLRLDSPWTIFYGFLALAGTANYLSTHFRAAVVLGLGLIVEYLGLRSTEWPPAWRAYCWTAAAWLFGASFWTARLGCKRSSEPGRNEIDRIWVWFRDRWGTVWALRIAEQFNRSAAIGGWPYRLSWTGLVPVDPESDAPVVAGDRASATLRGLLRRFVRPGRLDRVE
ncbi:hypothetical protein [Paludisphaera borealis]|uniref:Uncharacterized protein n=1 Tax=Paludisphaera borealis TaxID=1387353 RepID=A0A1U7CUU9_9BACT|nr:hypothetical protein [Paludisphaera borealis]APW62653.1 hypothetical protein BSF38_04203 [Paludisphaera borealis]